MACPLEGLSDELGMWVGLSVVMVGDVWLAMKSRMQSITSKGQYCDTSRRALMMRWKLTKVAIDDERQALGVV